MKILYFDTETTGLDPAVNEITQFAAIIEIDGDVVEEVNFRCQPTRWDAVTEEALKTTGVSLDELETYDMPNVVYHRIANLLDKYIPSYTRMEDKFYPAGHNVSFDLQFFDAFVKQHAHGDIKQYGSVTWQNWRALDTRVLANFLLSDGKHLPGIRDVKLSTLCNYFSIPIEAHDALSDIRATRLLAKALRSQFGVI